MTVDDVGVATTNDQVQFNLTFGQAPAVVNIPLGFDIGLAALGLEVDGQVRMALGYDCHLSFGVNRTLGFYLDTAQTNELAVSLHVSVPGLSAAGRLGPLQLAATDDPAHPSYFDASFAADLLDPSDADGKLTFSELVAADPRSLVSARFSATADVNLALSLGFGPDVAFPSLAADFALDWSFVDTPTSATGGQLGGTPQIAFSHMRVNLGDFFSQFVRPILVRVQDVTEPLQPLIDFLNSRAPVISDLIGHTVTWLEIAEDVTKFAQQYFGDSDLAIADTSMLAAIVGIANLVNDVPTDVDNIEIDLGSFNLAGTDPRMLGRLSDFTPTGGQIAPPAQSPAQQIAASSPAGAAFFDDSQDVGGTGSAFSFPLLTNPSKAFDLVLGKTLDLVTYKMPPLKASYDFKVDVPYPLPTNPPVVVIVSLRAKLEAAARLAFGFDTRGLALAQESHNPLDVLSGFYVQTQYDGQHASGLSIDGDVQAGASLGVPGFVSAGARAGVFADVTAKLHDPNHDGKVYADEFLENLDHGLLCTFDIAGSVQAGLRLFIELGYCPACVDYAFQIFPDQTIFSFDISQDDCFPDRFEPNGSRATAADLGVGPGIHVAGMSIADDADQDWYRFDVLRSADSLDVKLDYAPSRGNVNVDVLNAANQIVGRSTAVDTKDVATLTNVAPGTYYIHVYAAPVQAHGGPNAYKLYVEPSEKSQLRVLYVNPPDADPADSYYSLAPGNDANDGLSFLHPKATLAGLLAAQQLGPNDVVAIDTGTYTATATIGSSDAGALFVGSPGGSRLASGGVRIEINDSSGNQFSRLMFAGAGGTGILIRGDGIDDAHDNVIRDNQFTGAAAGVRLESQAANLVERNLFGAGGATAISLAPGAAAIVRRNDVSGRSTGIGSDSTVAEIYDNDLHDNSIGFAGSGVFGPATASASTPANRVVGNTIGVFVVASATAAVVRNNLVRDNGTGISIAGATSQVFGNDVHNNATGIAASGTASQIFGNDIHQNATGMSGSDTLGPADWSLPNDVHDNATGIAVSAAGEVRFNRVHGNTIGVISGGASYVHHNLIYRNIGQRIDEAGGGHHYSGRGVLLSGAHGAMVQNNTLYSPAGGGVELVASSANHIRNNIIWTEDGYDLYVGNDSQRDFDSDYNNLFASGLGVPVWWQQNYVDLYDWMAEVGYDLHSIGFTSPDLTLDNPQFVDLAADDYHLAAQVSTSIDAGDLASPFDLEPAPSGGRIDLGAYGNTSQAAASRGSFLQLLWPTFYTDWEASSEQKIVWRAFNVSGSVDVDLYREGVGKIADLGVVPVSAGSLSWSPLQSGIAGDTLKRYRLQLTSVSDATIGAQSREPFAVPVAGDDFFVDDASNAGDEYTPAAVGNNRGTGKSPLDPKAALWSILNAYDVGGSDVVHVDTGNHLLVHDVVLSGNPALGKREGLTITGPLDPNRVAGVTRGIPTSGNAVFEVNDGDFVTLAHLHVAGSTYGVWVHNASVGFEGTDLTSSGAALDGIRLEADAASAVVGRLAVDHAGRDGIVVLGGAPSLSDCLAHDNGGVGIRFANSGNAAVERNVAYANGGNGIEVSNGVGGTYTHIGSADLALAAGNKAFNNGGHGLVVSGPAQVAGNVAFGQVGANRFGIFVGASGQTEILRNVVFGNDSGIVAVGGATIAENRAYANANVGIWMDGAVVQRNVVYSNRIGIRTAGLAYRFGGQILNNLIYANRDQGIVAAGGDPGARIVNNTVYQPQGDAIRVQDGTTGLDTSSGSRQATICWSRPAARSA